MAGSRRALLLAAPALALSACGKAAERQDENPNVDTGTQKQGDVDLLNGLLADDAQRAPVLLATGAPAAARPLTRALAADAAAHRRTLEEAVRALGGRPASAGTPAGDGRFDAAAAATATLGSIRLYVDFIPKLSDSRVRRLVTVIFADKAARLAQLRLLGDLPPAPDAFVP